MSDIRCTARLGCLLLLAAAGAEAQVTSSGPLSPSFTPPPVPLVLTVAAYGSMTLQAGSPSSVAVSVTGADIASQLTSEKRAGRNVVLVTANNAPVNVTCAARLTLTNTTTPTATMLADTIVTAPAAARLGLITPPSPPPAGAVRGVILKSGSTQVSFNAWAKPPGGSWDINDLAGNYTGTMTVTMTLAP